MSNLLKQLKNSVQLVDFGLMGVLLDKHCEQVIDALGGVFLGQMLADVTQQHA